MNCNMGRNNSAGRRGVSICIRVRGLDVLQSIIWSAEGNLRRGKDDAFILTGPIMKLFHHGTEVKPTARQVARNTGKIFAQGLNKKALRGERDFVGGVTRCLMIKGNINQ